MPPADDFLTLLDLPPADVPVAVDAASSDADRTVPILGVEIADVTRRRACQIVEELIADYAGRCRSIYIANAHTLNLAAAEADYRRVLGRADRVFGDGTGVRWAARLAGVRLRDNLVGTDLLPLLFATTANRDYRYYLLGADEATIGAAARYAANAFPGWQLVGHHHGYLGDPALNGAAVHVINASRPHLLLVGMGNPLQERWIDENRSRLDVPVAIGVGGLFHYWAGTLRRSPGWLRRLGAEWLGILLQQPAKARRYLIGNPLFLWRILRWKQVASS